MASFAEPAAAEVRTSSIALAAEGRAEPSAPSSARVPGAVSGSGESLALRSKISGIVLDYGLPHHPLAKGRSHAGAIVDARLVWTLDDRFAIEAGLLARVPFALDIGDEADALPILALAVRPIGLDPVLVVTRFGSLDARHGYHPALVDEERYAYGRNYAETYRASLAPDVERNLGRDLFLPAEHGIQLLVDHELLHAEAFLDWQLLETKDHREKFAVGALAALRASWGELGFQLRLVHYGGERFTQTDPVRARGLDPVRQPTAYAFTARVSPPLPIDRAAFVADVVAAWVLGRIASSTHHGVEVGIDVQIVRVVRLGWRLWMPIDRELGRISEDGDPVYSGRRSHRARIGFATRVGPAELSGRLDLVFAAEGGDVQYETVTALAFSYDPVLWAAH